MGMHEEEARRRVQRGARLLDRVVPHWFKLVDRSSLNMASCSACICGQVGMSAGRDVLARRRSEDRTDFYGTTILLLRAAFRKGLRPKTTRAELNDDREPEAPGGRRIDARHYGFEAGPGRSSFISVSYSDLDYEWQREIEKRLAKAAARG